MALLDRGIYLDAVGDHDAAIEVFDDLVTRFREADDPVTADQVVRGRVNRAAALLATDRAAEAAVALSEVERCTDEDPAARSQVVAAHRERAGILVELGRDVEALATLDAVIDRFRGEPDPMVAENIDEVLHVRAGLVDASHDRDT